MLRQRNVALVFKKPDLAASVLQTRHHASTSKSGVADGVCVHVGIDSAHLDVDDDKVGDVLHVITNALLGQTFRGGVANQDVAGDATSDFVVDVTVDAELVLCPVDLDLERCQLQNSRLWNATTLTRLP
jgi:hypothetical protein